MLKQKSNSNSDNLGKNDQINAKQLKQIILSSEKSLPKLVSSTGEEVVLSQSVNDALYKILEAVEAGIQVTVAPLDRDMSIAEAADILNVSSAYLEKLLDREEIPAKSVGSTRYINTKDILNYKINRDTTRRKGLRELTNFLQETGCYAK
ncbi:MAG: helix-turn-helix domain-containing protein [Cyanobacteria bacterium P01_G01_bin.39]